MSRLAITNHRRRWLFQTNAPDGELLDRRFDNDNYKRITAESLNYAPNHARPGAE